MYGVVAEHSDAISIRDAEIVSFGALRQDRIAIARVAQTTVAIHAFENFFMSFLSLVWRFQFVSEAKTRSVKNCCFFAVGLLLVYVLYRFSLVRK
jgi:hypothetical protein